MTTAEPSRKGPNSNVDPRVVTRIASITSSQLVTEGLQKMTCLSDSLSS